MNAYRQALSEIGRFLSKAMVQVWAKLVRHWLLTDKQYFSIAPARWSGILDVFIT
jgi:hypothetical protein